MDYQTLATELAEPAYASHLPDGTPEICALLNAISADMVKSKFVSARTILAEVGASGAVTLNKLKAFANSTPSETPEVAALQAAVQWAMSYMVGETGVDVGHNSTRNMLDALHTLGVIDEGERIYGDGVNIAARLESLAERRRRPPRRRSTRRPAAPEGCTTARPRRCTRRATDWP
jgi:hypothetical protein